MARSSRLRCRSPRRFEALAGSPSAKQLLTHELAELEGAESRASEARAARRPAALERKAAIDAEFEAKRLLADV